MKTKITENLIALNQALNNLRSVVIKKQQALINNDSEMIDKISQAEQKAVIGIELIESERKEIIRSVLAGQANVNIESMDDFTELIRNQFTKEEFFTYRHLRNTAKELIQQIVLLNSQNKKLIDSSRSFIKEMITAIRGSGNQSLINAKV